MQTVRVFFNDAAGGSFRNPESRKRIEVAALKDRPHMPMAHGYVAVDAVLVESSVSPLFIDAVDGAGDHEACEQAFRLLNADDRPNGQFERSLSVGDVIQVEDRYFAVAGVGFDQIAKPEGLNDVKYRVDCAVSGEGNWASNALRFDSTDQAESYARDLFSRWMLLRGWRIVAESTPERESINEDEVQS